MKLARYKEAEEEFLTVLALDPENETAEASRKTALQMQVCCAGCFGPIGWLSAR